MIAFHMRTVIQILHPNNVCYYHPAQRIWQLQISGNLIVFSKLRSCHTRLHSPRVSRYCYISEIAVGLRGNSKTLYMQLYFKFLQGENVTVDQGISTQLLQRVTAFLQNVLLTNDCAPTECSYCA